MHGSSIATLMAVESARRALTEPAFEARPRAPRRTVARVLQALAQRLDPAVRTSTA